MAAVGHVKRQHVVSRGLLARFATDGYVEVEEKRHPGRWRLKSPAAVGYVVDFVRADSGVTEALWQRTETHIGTALMNLDVAGNERLVARDEQIIRDCLALHWARSVSLKVVSDRAWEKVRRASMLDLKNRPELVSRIYESRTGRSDPTPEDLQDVNESLHEGPDELRSGQYFADRIRYFFHQAQQKFAQRSLQVGRLSPDARDLVISDNPVLTPSDTRPGLNAEQGVALGDASSVGMPLGPRLFVSLHDEYQVLTVDDSLVASLNDWQAKVRQRHLIRRPSRATDGTVFGGEGSTMGHPV